MSEHRAALPEPTEIANRYVVERKLGAGAFGTVYKARDKILGRMVAIKTIRLEGLAASGASLDELMTRFMREAQVSAQLKHPNIVTIYDIGEASGMSYLAMEFIDGVGLEKVVREPGPMAIERAASIAAQVADALDYAHKQNVIHRDIKPANIMLEAGDRVKVADFGIARVTNSADHLTATGSLLGTPSYMSPEQARGRELDGRSDLFSVGCVLYELVAGRRAFRGESITGLIFKVITEEPEPLRELRPDIPEEMVRIVSKAMAKEPQARFQNGRELADALHALVSPGTTPTLRQTETPTEAVSGLEDLLTSQSAPTAVPPPTRVAPTAAAARAAPPPPPRPAKAASEPPAPAPGKAHAPSPTPTSALPIQGRAGSTGMFLGFAAAIAAVLVALLALGWFLVVKPRSAAQEASNPTPTTAPLTTLSATPRALVAEETAAAPPVVEEAMPARLASAGVSPPASGPATRPARPDPVPRPPDRGPAPRISQEPEHQVPVAPREPPGGKKEAAAEPALPAADYSHLDDDQALDGGEGTRSLPQQFRGSGSGRYRVRSRVPPALGPIERPAVATILHLVAAEEAYNSQHGRYGNLQQLVQSRAALLDVQASGNRFQRRSYRFELQLQDDGFQVVAVPSGSGRPFVGDDTGFIRVGLQ